MHKWWQPDCAIFTLKISSKKSLPIVLLRLLVKLIHSFELFIRIVTQYAAHITYINLLIDSILSVAVVCIHCKSGIGWVRELAPIGMREKNQLCLTLQIIFNYRYLPSNLLGNKCRVILGTQIRKKLNKQSVLFKIKDVSVIIIHPFIHFFIQNAFNQSNTFIFNNNDTLIRQ